VKQRHIIIDAEYVTQGMALRDFSHSAVEGICLLGQCFPICSKMVMTVYFWN